MKFLGWVRKSPEDATKTYHIYGQPELCLEALRAAAELEADGVLTTITLKWCGLPKGHKGEHT